MDYDKEEWKNQRLREEIVELADLWDGKESGKYGKIFKIILYKLEINDTPEYFSEDFDKFINETCMDCGLKMMSCKCDPHEYKDWGKK